MTRVPVEVARNTNTAMGNNYFHVGGSFPVATQEDTQQNILGGALGRSYL